MSEPSKGAVEARYRLLVVGESEPIRDVRAQLARSFGTESVTAVPTAADALDRIDGTDCVLCDPDAVSTLADGSSAPIVAVTTGDGAAAIEAGAVDVLSPTAPIAVVRARIGSVVSGTSSRAPEPADRYRTIFDASAAVVLVLDGDGTIEWATPATDRSLEYTPAELEGTDLSSIAHPDDRARVSEGVETVTTGSLDDRTRVRCRLRLGSGRIGRYRLDIRNRLSDPALSGLVCTVVPAADTPGADASHAQDVDTAARRTSVPESIGDPVVTVDGDWIVTAANDAAADLLSAESPIGREFWELLPPETLPNWFEALSAVRARGTRNTFEVPTPDADALYTVTAYPANGELTVLARRESDTAASRMRSELDATAAVLDAVPTPAFLVDADDRISIANAATFDYTGLATVVGKPLEAVLDDPVASAVSERANAAIRRVDPIEWTPTVGPTERTVELSVVPLPDDRAVVVGVDVTQRDRLTAGLAAVTEAVGSLREPATADRTREILTGAIRAAFDTEVAVWYRVDDGRLSPLRTAGLPDDGTPPPISMTDSRRSALVAEGPTSLGPDDRIPVGAGRVIVEPVSIPVADGAVVIAGNTAASDRESDELGTQGDVTGGSVRDSTGPQRDEGTDVTDPGAGRAVESQFPGPATRDTAAASPAAPAVGPAEDSRLESIGGLLGELAPLSLARAACLAEKRELASELDGAERFRATIDAVSGRRDAINRTLRTAETRDELEDGLCRELVELDAVEFAVIAGGRDDEIELRSHAGRVPSALTDDAAHGAALVDPIIAARQGLHQVVESIDGATGDRIADGSLVRSAIATPIAGTNRTYGVLAVYLSDHPETGVLSRLCGDVATGGFLAIDSIETRDALLADDTVELELSVPASDEFVLTALVRDGTTTVDVDAVATGADESTVYVTIRDPSGATADAVLESHPRVRAVRRRQPDDGAVGYEITVDSHPLVDAVASYGGVITSVSGLDGRAAVHVELPADRDVRSVVEAVQAVAPGTELAARRPTSGHGNRSPGGSELLARLTERQREILRTAYAAGYFEFPRERTGEEIAARLDISQPTFTRHFRAAERTIFSALFEEL